jgi:predicted DNA-binding transcriptional regulator AlpA
MCLVLPRIAQKLGTLKKAVTRSKIDESPRKNYKMMTNKNITQQAVKSKLLTSSEVAKKLKVSAKLIYGWMDEGNFPPSVRSGFAHRWRECDIEEWISKRITK